MSPVFGFTSAIFVSLAALAAFCTFSVDAVPPVAKPDKSITAVLPATVLLSAFSYVNVTFLLESGVYVPGVI